MARVGSIDLSPEPIIRVGPAAEHARAARRWLHRALRLGRAAELPALQVGFVALGAALAFGRLSLPLGIDFGYRSCARNVALVFVAGALLPGARRALPRSWIGPALAAFVLVAAASLAVRDGGSGNLRMLATALGLFYAARRVAEAPGGARWLFHWLGLLAVAILVREVWHDPTMLALRESRRLQVVTEHPNTLGFAAALVTPLFLARTACVNGRRSAWLYAACSSLTVLITYSRAAWAGLALAAVTLVLGSGGGSPRVRLWRLLTAAFTFTMVAIATVGLSADRWGADAQRVRIVETSLSLFREHWLLGIGFGGQSLQRLFPQRYLELHGESLFLFHSHNLYVDVLTGTGVVGMAAALALLLAIASVALRGVRAASAGEQRSEALGYAASIGVFFLLALADMPLYHGRLVVLSAVVWAMSESAWLRSSASVAQKSGTTANRDTSRVQHSSTNMLGTRFAEDQVKQV